MSLVDVHICHLPGENQEWWQKCQDSLVGHPINVHNVDGIVGDFRRARYNGFCQGTSPYVSFVDPDDYVLPHTFEKCLEALEQTDDTVCGVYTQSKTLRLDKHGRRKFKIVNKYMPWKIEYMKSIDLVHQIIVYKRDILMKMYDKNFDKIPKMKCTDYAVNCLLAVNYDWHAVDHVGYVWRIHPDGMHHRMNHKDGIYREDYGSARGLCWNVVDEGVRIRKESNLQTPPIRYY